MRLFVYPAAQRELDVALPRSKAEFGPGMLARLLMRSEHSGLALLRHRTLGTASAAQARKLPTRLLPCKLMGRSEGEVIHGIALLQPSRAPCCRHGRW
jgi:hypothetical protein